MKKLIKGYYRHKLYNVIQHQRFVLSKLRDISLDEGIYLNGCLIRRDNERRIKRLKSLI